MRIAVVGSGMAGLTAARTLSDHGHSVVVVDKGRLPGGRMATTEMVGGARSDKGAQFFTARSPEMTEAVGRWTDVGLVHRWCSGFTRSDGHPRYATSGGMARLMGHLAEGLDVRQSVHVDAVRPSGFGWEVAWPEAYGSPAGSLVADAVVVTTPVPQAAALLDGIAAVPDLAYDATISLTLALSAPASVPSPGGVQLSGDPVWSWIGDNVAKGTSSLPALTLHTTAEFASAHWDDDAGQLMAELVALAVPWTGGAAMVDVRLHRWRYATPVEPYPERFCEVAPGLYLAGDAFGGPRVEGAFLSGLAAADRIDVDGPQLLPEPLAASYLDATTGVVTVSNEGAGYPKR